MLLLIKITTQAFNEGIDFKCFKLESRILYIVASSLNCLINSQNHSINLLNDAIDNFVITKASIRLVRELK